MYGNPKFWITVIRSFELRPSWAVLDGGSLWGYVFYESPRITPVQMDFSANRDYRNPELRITVIQSCGFPSFGAALDGGSSWGTGFYASHKLPPSRAPPRPSLSLARLGNIPSGWDLTICLQPPGDWPPSTTGDGRAVGRTAGQLVGRLDGRIIGLSTDHMIERLVGRMVGGSYG